MLAAETIDKKITSLLTGLSLQQKKTVLTVVKAFVKEHAGAWEAMDYEDEMEKRFTDYENGKVKAYTIQETITAAKRLYKAKQEK